jgi:hypothetical protein
VLSGHPPRRAASVIASVVILAVMGGCQTAESSPSPTGSASGGLPGPSEGLPPGVRGAMAWTSLTAYAESFDPRAAYDSPRAAADAFGEALLEGSAPGPDRPRLLLEPVVETDARAILVITESGVGDPAVMSSQHALVMVEGTGTWHITSTWSRILCVGGVDPSETGCG